MTKQSEAAKAAEKEAEIVAASPVVAGVTAPHVQRADLPVGATQQILPPSGAPGAQMVKVKEVATGRVFATWPVDARELVTHPNQDHVYATAEDEMSATAAGSGNPTPVPPDDSTSPVAVDPVAATTPPRAGAIDPLTATAQLQELSTKELKDMAKRSGVSPDQSKEKLVEALQPHVSAGTLSLAGAQGHGLPPSTR